ncbi:hypothetical protein C0V75_09415 [Tabrizicola sp. TH137]|uniref:hypothetical protein n=1 Tax=Tabrizicola sp. TH137 TaxID=2067452 RepID=UPI000C7AF735|nr:hypothetical protein [Tabrizicola sp. TH137]PLL13566.1 hypothetical protein C0V75_09415 [Tabrizicola sp. TH137]
MQAWLEQALSLLSASAAFRSLALAIPLAITVAALAGWRQRVEGAGQLALFGLFVCLWLAMPWTFAYLELQQASLALSLLCWFWLLLAWARHVLGDWPAPIWGHWLVGTLLWVLPVTGAIVLIRG